jgi:hypothetical protein
LTKKQKGLKLFRNDKAIKAYYFHIENGAGDREIKPGGAGPVNPAAGEIPVGL